MAAARFSLQLVLRRSCGPKALRPFAAAGAALLGTQLYRAARCDSKAQDDDDEDFDFQFAKPPVEPAAFGFSFSHRLQPSTSGSRPTVEVEASSTFSLPVERGWPRDTLQPEEVACHMRDTLADRLPRWGADHFGLELIDAWGLAWTGIEAPPALRSLSAWPQASDPASAPAAVRCWLWPFPLLTFQLLEGGEKADLARFKLGGFLCSGSETSELHIVCRSLGSFCPLPAEGPPPPGEEGERLDLRLTTRLVGVPAAGRAWAFVGCGGSWWFERVRLPIIRRCFQEFHQMTHDQMMLHFVAALAT